MRIYYLRRVVFVFVSFALLPLVLTGCQTETLMDGGPEVRYLTSKPPVVKDSSQPLLPLTNGTAWNMITGDGGNVKIEGRVAGQDAAGNILIEFRKNGSLWRREVYKNTATGLFLTGMGEDTKPMMQLIPPVPLLHYPLHEGDGQSWTGTFRYGSITYAATSFSRISAVEDIKSTVGKNTTYRVDTLITINQDGRLVKFPTLRWMSPGIGFIRHSFVDEGRNYVADLQKFTPG